VGAGSREKESEGEAGEEGKGRRGRRRAEGRGVEGGVWGRGQMGGEEERRGEERGRAALPKSKNFNSLQLNKY
jgi:hypothetical protein